MVGKRRSILISLGGDDQDRRALRPHILHQLQHLAITQHSVRIRRVVGGNHYQGRVRAHQCVWTMLQFTCRIALCLKIGRFFQLQRSFTGNRIVNATAQIEKSVRILQRRRETRNLLLPLIEYRLKQRRERTQIRGVALNGGRGHSSPNARQIKSE